ncbi:MAG: exodeoxyribonuclease VII large subunit [Candidatus Cloacimonadaceae bacterium]|jgi:exodeoxyribonuclease VII large subunit|nr:exodeoxyribonuclease VII large subunit [Candidatus Cloacimonadota bacterium]MDY0112325.1 exodeoxyribonuclease VII large subunit [Candidatus Syntrophosphaera sp.]
MEELIIFSVSEVTAHLKQVIEAQIEPLYVRGEISNYTRHPSGHIYFSLKDANATLRCTFFRNSNIYLDFEPEEGMEVICFGKLTIYEKGSTYHLNVYSMQMAGKGNLARQFELLKKKLQAEGLFEESHKKPLPKYPRRIGIVTSPAGAALQDILNILRRRYPVEVIVFPALVQGEDAPPSLIQGIRYFNEIDNVDVIILTRGGGSQEDLFCFNDEQLARTIYDSKIPVISAVGHEIDFTIADFVADLRAPTPSAAAELAVPNRADIINLLKALEEKMTNSCKNKIYLINNQINELQLNLTALHPRNIWQNYKKRIDQASIEFLNLASNMQQQLHRYSNKQVEAFHTMQYLLQSKLHQYQQNLDELILTLPTEMNKKAKETENRISMLQIQLESVSPTLMLKKGYALVQKGEHIITSVKELTLQEELLLRMKDGAANVTVKDIFPDSDKNSPLSQ